MSHNFTSEQPTPQLVVHYGGFSHQGPKAENQDAFSAAAPSAYVTQTKGVVATIADGVSSANCARKAARLAATQFIQDYYSTPDTWSTNKSAAKVLTSINQWMCGQANSLGSSSQQWLTTFSGLVIKSATGYLFHIGDSRIAQYRAGSIDGLTREHHHKRINNMVLTRALGADLRLQVDVHQVNLQQNDIYILTTDGVHEHVSVNAFQHALSSLPPQPKQRDLEQASENLVELAIKNGSQDNVSCLLVYIEALPARTVQEVEKQLLAKKVLPRLDVGMKLDGYRIVKTIYESSRSHLYLVEHDSAKDAQKAHMVLKVPSLNFSEDPIYLQGFIREAWLGERVNHPNIMSIKRGPSAASYLYHFCEFIEGQTLAQWRHDNPAPTVHQVRDIATQIISALRAFQRLEVVHRDLKPENIMIDAQGKITLIDYGSAYIASLMEDADSLTEEVPQGTLNYVAPETLINMRVDHQSDLFSLGVIVYELLTGQLPFKPMSVNQALKANFDDWQYQPLNCYRKDLPVWLDYALNQATQPEPSYRFDAYSEFEAALNKPDISAVEEYNRRPLLQKNPVQFWQGVSLILFVLLLSSLMS